MSRETLFMWSAAAIIAILLICAFAILSGR